MMVRRRSGLGKNENRGDDGKVEDPSLPFSAPLRMEVCGLGKAYGGSVILDDVGFTVVSPVSMAFMSPSGSGKSTLLSMLGLLLKPSTGTVKIDGVDTVDLDDRQRAALRRDRIGFVFQHTQLVGSLRAIENVIMPASFMPRSSFDYPARARELLEGFGLADRLEHYPHQLSVGQKRRVAVARALILNPTIVIADEPTNDLDEESACRVSEALFDHVSRGGILLYATHDRSFAARADRVMRLENSTFVEV